MKLKVNSTYIEEIRDYRDFDEAVADAAAIALIESRTAKGIGSAVISDAVSSVARVVVTSGTREIQPLQEATQDRVSSRSVASKAL